MEQNEIKMLLQQVADGKTSVDEAFLQIKKAPFRNMEFARPDLHRGVRQGAAEVIYGAGKTPEQILAITEELLASGQRTVLITRTKPEAAELLRDALVPRLGLIPVKAGPSGRWEEGDSAYAQLGRRVEAEESAPDQTDCRKDAGGALSGPAGRLEETDDPVSDFAPQLSSTKCETELPLKQGGGSEADVYGEIRTAEAIKPERVNNIGVIAYDELSGIMIVGEAPKLRNNSRVVVATGGTSDMPVAEEAAKTAEAYGCKVVRLYDVGVAGLHRLMSQMDELMTARVVIAIAGMEGALASVIGGLVDCPVIAVPTSVGYGASFGGLAALLSMLNSCASGVSVVNIDNGFGAGYLAAMIDRPDE